MKRISAMIGEASAELTAGVFWFRALRAGRPLMAKNVNAGRPQGRATVFRGITEFCRATGYTHQHVREVLSGGRRSARVRGLWAQWQARKAR